MLPLDERLSRFVTHQIRITMSDPDHVDTAGLDAAANEELESAVQAQALEAVAEADAILFVVDGKAGLLPEDATIAATLRKTRKPLIVMTPKSLLRNKASTSELELLAQGSFRKVIKDRRVEDGNAVKRVVLSSGKVWYDLDGKRMELESTDVALVRVEQLHPFPEALLRETLALYTNATEVVWCQEEPKNQGAWYQIRHHLQACAGDDQKLLYAGRERSASPAVGKFAVHQKQQNELVRLALSPGEGDQS